MDFSPHTEADHAEMLVALGLSKFIDELFAAIPAHLRARTWDLLRPLSELEVGKRLAHLAQKNARGLTCFLGAGFYDHFIPAAVDALIRRSEFYHRLHALSA